jgi:CubicO group peptidase (beta-lactamase class C family)
LAVSVLCVASSVSAASPGLPAGTAERLHSDLDAAMRHYGIPGATVIILKNHQIVYEGAFGLSDVEKRVPASVRTHYEIGSITKQFTAAAIVRLSEAGKLNLDAAVATYLPAAPHAGEITVRQLLAQTSGLPDYLDGPDIDRVGTQPATFEQLLSRVADKPLAFTPGSGWQYSNTNYLILGKLVELASGERYDDYIRRQFLEPVGMTTTFTIGDEPRVPDMAFGYRRVDGALEPARGTIGQSFASSAGDLVSTAGNLAKWSDAFSSGRVLPASAYAMMATSQTTSQAKDTGYGFGLFVDSLDGQPRVGHTGGDPSFTAADEFFPAQGVIVIALTNDGNDNGHPEAGEILTTVAFEALFPDIAAAALRPSAGEDPAVTQRVKSLFEQIQSGREDYAALTPRLADKLRGGLASTFASEFSPYGPPTAAVFRGERTEAGKNWFDYVIHFGPGVSLKFSVAYDAGVMVTGLSFG